MKLGFWNLAMPPWSNEEIVQQAKKHGYAGVDLRCTRPDEHGRPAGGGNLCVDSPDDEVSAIRRAFDGSGVEITSLLCYLPPERSAGALDWSWYQDDVAAHSSLADRVGAARIRLGTGSPAEGVGWEQHLEQLWLATQRGLRGVPGVGVVFENHTGRPRAEELLAAAERAGDERIGVEYSPDHALVMQEDPVEVIEGHVDWVHQVCFADRRVEEERLGEFDGRYYHVRYESCLPGEGLVPAERIFRTLERSRYDRYVTLKWERPVTFPTEVTSGETVLPIFANFMRSLGVIDR
jgi:sugar phosphate isomerase/epimerase